MDIALTYDLKDHYHAMGLTDMEIAEFDSEETVDGIAEAISALGHNVEKIGTVMDLVQALGKNEKWGLVFNIGEGLHGPGRESQIPCLLEAYQIPYTFSDPLVLAITLDKGIAKRVARDMGFPTADFSVIRSAGDIDGVTCGFPSFIKPIAEGSSKGISEHSIVHTKEELSAVCNSLLESFKQPVLVESYLPGREFTVGILGTGIRAQSVGVMEVVCRDEREPRIYSFIKKQNYREKVEYRFPDDRSAALSAEMALNVWKKFGCRDSGRVDIKLDDDGVPHLIEINPLAGLNPEHSDLCIICRHAGISYRELISHIIDSAMERV